MSWQPIATAPRDGTHIIARRVLIGIRFTNNTNPPTVVHWFDDPDEPGFYTSVNERAPEHPFEATHWMPVQEFCVPRQMTEEARKLTDRIEQAIADFYPAWERKPDFARFIAAAIQPVTLAREEALDKAIAAYSDVFENSGSIDAQNVVEIRRNSMTAALDAILALTPSHEVGTHAFRKNPHSTINSCALCGKPITDALHASGFCGEVGTQEPVAWRWRFKPPQHPIRRRARHRRR